MQKDIAEKRLEDHEDVFADVFNVLLFQGEMVLEPENLEAVSTEAYHQDEEGQWRQRWRDVVKKDVEHDVILGIYGIENQTKRDNTMPVRVMGYDFASYNRQIEELMKENEKKNCPAYVKRIHDEQRLAPYIQDYKLNLVELSSLPEEVVCRFQSDFRFVAEYMTVKSDKERLKRFMADRTRIIAHPAEFLDMMGAITSDKRYREIKEQVLGKKEGLTMCGMLDELENRGIEKGIEKGALDKTKVFIQNLLQRGMPDEDICGLAECSRQLVDEVREALGEKG